MRICLISLEIFAWGKYGGFGRATRTIGGELARRGHDVYAVVPRRKDQRPIERLDGITVLSFPSSRLLSAAGLLRQVDADIYHSCEPWLVTWLAQKARPDRAHMVTFRDPRGFEDWRTEFAMPSRNRLRVVVNYLLESGPPVRRAVRRADAVYAAAHCLIPKARAVYGLASDPQFLPTPVEIPETAEKASEATVCFVSRLDRRKRPERFLDLAARFPDVRFVCLGESNDPEYDRRLRDRYAGLPNLDMKGFVDQFRSDEHSRTLARSWILVSTAAREGLPNSFLEAASYRCAILSAVDPDGFASRFGHRVEDDDFEGGLRHLLEGDRWRQRGVAGYRYVADTFATDRSVQRHLDAYATLLADS